VGVDKAGNDDSIRAVDQSYVSRRGDLSAYLANLAVLNQYVAFGEVSNLGIEGEEDSPFDEDPARISQAHKCRIARILGARGTRESLSGDAAGENTGAGSQQCAP
jgi:hypothetical protein